MSDKQLFEWQSKYSADLLVELMFIIGPKAAQYHVGWKSFKYGTDYVCFTCENEAALTEFKDWFNKMDVPKEFSKWLKEFERNNDEY